MILPGGVEALAKWYDADPRSGDLVHGPMIYDDFVRFATHFNDQWRAEMWGTWGRAWVRPGDGLLVSPVESGNRVEWRELCQRATDGPDLPWSGHEAKLAQLGYQTPAEPFDIPGQGLGLFACRRDAWLRFNPLFRGFGGEEMYIHRKFRNAGRRTVCIPGLKWSHRFGRPGGAPYPLTVEDKSRNYVLGLTELGLPLDPARNLLAPRIGQDRWDRIVYKATGQQPAGPEPKTCAPRSGPSHREQLEARHRGRGALMAFRGIDAAIVNDFLIAHPEWVMMKESGGVTTLSRRPEDRKPLPSLTRQAINYAGAVAGHVAAGRPQASPELVKLRLDMCAICPERNGKRCSKCGCPVESKAKWAEQKCPLGKWPSE
jgi:hypothetical protein